MELALLILSRLSPGEKNKMYELLNDATFRPERLAPFSSSLYNSFFFHFLTSSASPASSPLVPQRPRLVEKKIRPNGWTGGQIDGPNALTPLVDARTH